MGIVLTRRTALHHSLHRRQSRRVKIGLFVVLWNIFNSGSTCITDNLDLLMQLLGEDLDRALAWVTQYRDIARALGTRQRRVLLRSSRSGRTYEDT